MGRPLPQLNGYYGQRQIVAGLLRLAHGAKHRMQAMMHILLLGASGSGKSHLGTAIAAAYGTTFHYVLASTKFTPARLQEEIEKWKPRDFIFIDEIHSLPPNIQELLFPILLDGLNASPFRATLKSVTGDGATAPPVRAHDPAVPESALDSKITVFGATDRPGILLDALKKRFGYTVELLPYSLLEMTQIVRARAGKHGLLLTPHAARVVAASCNGLPRTAGDRLQMLAHALAADNGDPTELTAEPLAADAGDKTVLTAERVRACFEDFGIDLSGLSPLSRNYLRILNERQERGAQLGELAALLRIDRNYIQRDVEPALRQRNYILVDERRFITDAGIKFLEETTIDDDIADRAEGEGVCEVGDHIPDAVHVHGGDGGRENGDIDADCEGDGARDSQPEIKYVGTT